MAGYIALAIIVCLALIYFIVILVIRAHRKQAAAGREGLIGKTGIVETPLAPKGVVLVEGERWTAVIDQGRAEPEEEVRIVRVDGLKLLVTKKGN